MQKIMVLMASVLALVLLQGCENFKNEPVGSDQILAGYSPALKDCLRKCQVKYADQLDNGNDLRRGCACECHKANGTVGMVANYCRQSQDGILQSSNADTLTDMKSKSGW